jgi:hypothetical protein
MRQTTSLGLALVVAIPCFSACGAVVETRDEPLSLGSQAISDTAPMGLAFGQSKDDVDDAASNEWGVRPATCTNGRINTGIQAQTQQMNVGGKSSWNTCSYLDSECDEIPSPDPRLDVYRCDYPGSLVGGDGREMVLTFFNGKLGGVGIYDSFIDEATARQSGDNLITSLNTLFHRPAPLTKPGRAITDPQGQGLSGTIDQRVSWSTSNAEVRLELIEMENHVWSLGYTTFSRDSAVWFAGTDSSGNQRAATDGSVTVGGGGAFGTVTASSKQLGYSVEALDQLSDRVGLCLPPSRRPPPQNANASTMQF